LRGRGQLVIGTRRELVDEMLEAVDATSFANQRVGSLSGGEQQRIMIAHAPISQPRLLAAQLKKSSARMC
jgi:ABC-type Mn2+/Zn2+ transport system ATPase subunit